MPAFFSLLVACKPPDPGVFIGTVGALDSRIGIVTNPTKGRIYVGGGPLNLDRHHTFMDVKIDKNKLEGISKEDQLSIEAKGDSGAWRGTFVDSDNSGQSVVMFPPDQVDSGG